MTRRKSKTLGTKQAARKQGPIGPGAGEELSYTPFATSPAIPSSMPAGSFRKSRHLSSQVLKYDTAKSPQRGIFEDLSSDTKDEILKHRGSLETMVEGIRLSPAEMKLVDTLCKLLHHRSQREDPKKDSYYQGDGEPASLRKYGDSREQMPSLALSLYEVAQEYKGGDAISGKDAQNVLEILRGLAERKFLIRYTAKEYRDTKRTETSIETYGNILSLPTLEAKEYDLSSGALLSSKKEVLVWLSPIFRHQIDSNFITVPNDITKRTALAYGSHNVSEATLRLRDVLLQEMSFGKATYTVSQEKLYERLAEKMMKEGRRKLVGEHVQKAIETVQRLGLLWSWELSPSEKTGELLYRFTLNPEFQ